MLTGSNNLLGQTNYFLCIESSVCAGLLLQSQTRWGLHPLHHMVCRIMPPHNLKMSRPSFSEPMNMLAYIEKELCNEILINQVGPIQSHES